jgi:hypothetical protein
MAGRRIKISVATACVDCAVPDTYILQTVGVVGADRYIAGDVGHVVVDARVPTQRELWNQITKAPGRTVEAVRSHERDATAAWSC